MFCRLQTRSFKLISFLLNTALHNYYNTIKSTKFIFRRVTCKLGDLIDSSSTFNSCFHSQQCQFRYLSSLDSEFLATLPRLHQSTQG